MFHVSKQITLCLKSTIVDLLFMYIQYWCIDGKYRIYVARFRNGNNQYCIYPAIKFAQKMLSNLIIIKKITENPIDTSIVIPVSDVA